MLFNTRDYELINTSALFIHVLKCWVPPLKIKESCVCIRIRFCTSNAITVQRQNKLITLNPVIHAAMFYAFEM